MADTPDSLIIPATVASHSRTRAILEAVIASMIWATSFVFVRVGMDEVGPLTMAGLRYFAAFVLMLPFIRWRANARALRSKGVWLRLIGIALGVYTVGNGALYWSLKYISPTTASFIVGLLPLLVLAAGIAYLRERPTMRQVGGVGLCVAGCALFFAMGLAPGQPLGLAIAVIGVVGFAVFAILSRDVARMGQLDTFTLTALPLGLGGASLLILAISVEGVTLPSWRVWALVAWLASVNTVLAYILYNRSLKILTALEANVAMNLSPFATALVSFVILGERLTPVQVIGMVIGIVGVALVQVSARPSV
ncbi:MAG TPA: DMT family transporter [Anaerolineales bacterium]|nr:DMT family transporter [Anaerolineales bacterium]